MHNDSELVFSAVSLFPLLDPAKLLEEQSAEFGPYVLPESTYYRYRSRRRNYEPHESLFFEQKRFILVVFAGASAKTQFVP